MTSACNPEAKMPSNITTPVATRVPNHVADHLRQQARQHGVSLSAVTAAYLNRAMADALHDETDNDDTR